LDSKRERIPNDQIQNYEFKSSAYKERGAHQLQHTSNNPKCITLLAGTDAAKDR
jgi:spermidine synthase